MLYKMVAYELGIDKCKNGYNMKLNLSFYTTIHSYFSNLPYILVSKIFVTIISRKKILTSSLHHDWIILSIRKTIRYYLLTLYQVSSETHLGKFRPKL